MDNMCTDNRFELIEKYKKELIESTNIETSQDEMAVLDNLLFRFWQMGWLDRLEQPERKTGELSDYIKREDAIKAMAQYLMDMALIDNPEASDRIKEWEGSIAAPVMSTVKAADVVEVVRCKDCKYGHLRDNTKRNSSIYCDFGIGVHKENYCSFGERADK